MSLWLLWSAECTRPVVRVRSRTPGTIGGVQPTTPDCVAHGARCGRDVTSGLVGSCVGHDCTHVARTNVGWCSTAGLVRLLAFALAFTLTNILGGYNRCGLAHSVGAGDLVRVCTQRKSRVRVGGNEVWLVSQAVIGLGQTSDWIEQLLRIVSVGETQLRTHRVYLSEHPLNGMGGG